MLGPKPDDVPVSIDTRTSDRPLASAGRPPGLRPALAEFAAYMEHKLRLNDHKPNWRTCSLGYLRERLSQELAELDEALEASDPHLIYDECADVANFAMMIADRTKLGRRGGGMTVDRC